MSPPCLPLSSARLAFSKLPGRLSFLGLPLAKRSGIIKRITSLLEKLSLKALLFSLANKGKSLVMKVFPFFLKSILAFPTLVSGAMLIVTKR